MQDLIVRMLGLNFAAIHTTSMVCLLNLRFEQLVTLHFQTVTAALYVLAAHSEYVQILRDEVEAAIAGEGMTKAAMGKMNKLDSFVKEAQRLYGGVGVCKSLLPSHQSILTI